MSYSSRKGQGPPVWFVFLLAVAFVFGVYYLWVNFRAFLQTGGISVAQATEQSQVLTTATAEQRAVLNAGLPTRRPSPTPRPTCQDFEVSAASGNMRQSPTTNAPLIESLPQGTVVCVLGSENGSDDFIWYLIDRDPVTRLIETGYMREDVIQALHPTPTPSNTARPAPTITPTYTYTPSATPLVPPSATPDANATPTPTPTPTSTTTPARVNI